MARDRAAGEETPATRATQQLLRLQSLLGNTGVQRLLVQRASGSGQTLQALVSGMTEVGAPPAVETVLAAARRESSDTCLNFYVVPTIRVLIRSRYNEKDARRVLGSLLRKPYTPGAQSILYKYLDEAERDEVNAEVNARFVEETGISGSLDWNDAADKPFARRWLMLRDDVMDERAAAEEDEAEKQFKADLVAKAGKPADLHATLKALDADQKLKLITATAFKKKIRDALGDWEEFAGCIEDLGGRAPNKAELATNATVIAAINDAWKDSNPSAPLASSRDEIETHNHEEGGWVYVNLVTNKVVTRRQLAKDNTFFETDPSGNLYPWISLEFPPEVADSVLVANFHTHPNQPRYAGASADDGRSIDSRKVPGLLRDSEGIGAYGTAEHRASLRGSQGYPE